MSEEREQYTISDRTTPADATPEPSITVCGITFTAEQVKSATLEIDGREVDIGEKCPDVTRIGFTQHVTRIMNGESP